MLLPWWQFFATRKVRQNNPACNVTSGKDYTKQMDISRIPGNPDWAGQARLASCSLAGVTDNWSYWLITPGASWGIDTIVLYQIQLKSAPDKSGLQHFLGC